jgi:CRISPR-associated protein Cas8a1/Csx13
MFTLEYHLHDSALGPMHRAGLGGLACVLDFFRERVRRDPLLIDQVPGAPWPAADQPPWTITPVSVELRIGEPKQTRQFLEKLFQFAFTISDGLIECPAWYPMGASPQRAVRVRFHEGLLLTFLQHPKACRLSGEEVFNYEHPSKPGEYVSGSYQKCERYKHQRGWDTLTDKSNGHLTLEPIEIAGPLNPGAVVRHGGFGQATTFSDDPRLALLLYFSLVGCVALPVKKGTGVLLVPQVTDLEAFASSRRSLTPCQLQDCLVASPADAVMLLELQRIKNRLVHSGIRGWYAFAFRTRSWSPQQKVRVKALDVPELPQRAVELYEVVRLHLRDLFQETKLKAGKARRQTAGPPGTPQGYFVPNPVRELVAENLVLGRPWYAGFTRLMWAVGEDKQPVRKQVSKQREELYQMTEHLQSKPEHQNEIAFVRLVQDAIRRHFGRIAEETSGAGRGELTEAVKNRWERFRERLRLDLVNAKTEDQCRFVLARLFSSVGAPLAGLSQSLPQVLHLVRQDWKLGRDLALLALASYRGEDKSEDQDSTADD